MPYTTINRPSATVPATTTGCGCGCGCSSCVTCASLQCLCRPRFFAGQLVTDADFRRLDSYLVGKDRLHNRFLHGTGVVCGLEVVCDPCADTVTVRPGYALGPCGEDIVVCSAATVPVAALIRADRQAHARAACPPGSDAYTSTPNDCDALEQRWVLGICYDEHPGRPVTSLTTTSCSSSCNCGCRTSQGTSSGCGCETTSARPAPVGCEPTVVCEGYRFVLTKEKPVRLREPGAGAVGSGGALAGQVRQCLAILAANITSVPKDASAAELVTYCCRLKADLRAVIDSSAVHDCTLGRRLNDVACPSTNDADAAGKAKNAVAQLLALAIDLYRECVCSAMLPPCPDDCADDCVPIATLTVRSSDLQVTEVCNWSARKFAVGMPTLGYWLSWLPFGASLRRVVSSMCCPPERTGEFTVNDKLHVTAETTGERVAQSQPAASAFAAPLQMAMHYAESASPLTGFEGILLQSIGATGERGEELATSDELADPFAAAALSRLFGPAGLDLGGALRDVAGRGSAQPAAEAQPAPGTPAEADHASRLAELEKSVESLQRTVRSQARTISNLRKGQQK